MNWKYLPSIAGVSMLGVFIANVYIGLYDSNLATYNPLHYDLNWLIAVVDIIAAVILLSRPKSRGLLILSGILWPIVYLLSLGGDVATSMCLGTPSNPNCWPTTFDAFKYLILGDPSEGWSLWQGTIPAAIVLLVVTIVLMSLFVRHIRITKTKGPVQNNQLQDQKTVIDNTQPV
ncbi:MAG TPA: hypothetical protein VJN71_00230 [Nitrososphaerales archaeon]|nr:hypothetical protein [Nitrososphaerales archaeon]